jgi:general stress protein 26
MKRVPAMSSPPGARNDPRMEHDAVRAVAPSLTERQIMTNKNLADIAEEMAGIDIAILSTHAENGEIANRPMSNNGDVSYDGTSYYFTYEQARAVADIQRNPKVALGFSSEGGIFSDGIYVAVEGTAELIRDKAAFQQHWTSDLDNWFEKGVNTPGIVLIKVRPPVRPIGRDAKRARSASEHERTATSIMLHDRSANLNSKSWAISAMRLDG